MVTFLISHLPFSQSMAVLRLILRSCRAEAMTKGLKVDPGSRASEASRLR